MEQNVKYRKPINDMKLPTLLTPKDLDEYTTLMKGYVTPANVKYQHGDFYSASRVGGNLPQVISLQPQSLPSINETMLQQPSHTQFSNAQSRVLMQHPHH